jgi:hypothetical protein
MYFSVFGLIRKLDSVMGHTIDQLSCMFYNVFLGSSKVCTNQMKLGKIEGEMMALTSNIGSSYFHLSCNPLC